jgi:hypothetical protein
MIFEKLELMRRAMWIWRQPLTRQPSYFKAPISDLFVWRSSAEWQTFFEIIDIASLFDDSHVSGHVTLVFFDIDGTQFLEVKVELLPHLRKTLDISSLIGCSHGVIGTFSVFHSVTPEEVTNLGAYIAERGYVSYCYRNAPLRAYVHGNLDAIAMNFDGSKQLIGGRSFFKRSYSLQHELRPGIYYDYGLVNPTTLHQHFTCKLISVKSGLIVFSETLNVAPGGVRLGSISSENNQSLRLIIESRLVMSRPLIFSLKNHKLDVFHG